jgi:hypothetical protein
VAGTNQCRLLGSPIASDTASYFTSDGLGVVVSAPGEDREDVSRGCLIKSVGILSTRLGGGTTRMSGTSMAAPHVAGIAARHYQQDPGYTPADIRQFLEHDADNVGTAPLNSPTSSYSPDGERGRNRSSALTLPTVRQRRPGGFPSNWRRSRSFCLGNRRSAASAHERLGRHRERPTRSKSATLVFVRGVSGARLRSPLNGGYVTLRELVCSADRIDRMKTWT